MSELRRYPDYKDSGVPWLGEIPSHWEVIDNKFIFNFSRGLTITKANLVDEGIPCINYGEVHSKYGFEVDPKIHKLKCVPKEYVENFDYALLNRGDFIFADTSEDYKGSGNFTYLNSDEMTFAGYHTVVARLKTDDNPRFMAYLFDSNEFRTQVKTRVSGVKVFSITHNILKNVSVWIPPKDEQQAIVNFLDNELEHIDTLISKQQQLIERLAEQRSAVITHAVTKGLDTNVAMKDSGVEWLGDIPEHWKLMRLRYLCRITTGNQDTQDRDPDGIYPFYVRSNTVERTHAYTFDNEAVLMAGDGVGAGKIFHYVNGKYGCHQRVYSLYNLKDIHGQFLYYYLKLFFPRKIEEGGAKSTVDSVRLPMLQDFPVSLPPIKEQLVIVENLETDINKIDQMSDSNKSIIAKLQEYRSALITQAVTGKIDVRDIAKGNRTEEIA